MSIQTVRSICFECHSRCGVILEVKDSKLIGVKGDPDHPTATLYLPKGRAAMEIIYHPERITKPLIKAGGKDSTRFEEASWDKALDIIAENLMKAKDKWGAESVVFGTGTTRGMAPYLNRFLTLFGSPNFMAPSNMSGGPIVLAVQPHAASAWWTRIMPTAPASSCGHTTPRHHGRGSICMISMAA